MKKVLITGTTASHTSVQANLRNMKFTGLLSMSLIHSGVEIELRDVSSSESFEQYDKVIVGLSPFTSLSSNKIYNALDTINRSGDKTVLLMDSPDPHLVYRSMISAVNNPSIMSKDLYSQRRDFQEFINNKKFSESVVSGMNKVLNEKLPLLVPSVPYFSHTTDSLRVTTEDLIELNFDSFFESDNYHEERKSSKYWLADSRKNIWVEQIKDSVSNPVLNFKRSHYDSDIDLVDRIIDSFGYLKNNHKYDNPWWSRNIMLTLSCGIPVFSDWRHTSKMGDSWSLLPHTVEEMSNTQRKELSLEQKSSYLSLCPSWEEICDYTVSQLNK